MGFDSDQPAPVGDTSAGNAFVLIHRRDNVLICCRALPAGFQFEIDGHLATLPQPIDIGHKIARTPLAAGDKVYRHGLPIGSMTAAAAIGDHVHTHNLASDYIPIHGRDAVHIKDGPIKDGWA